MPRARSAVPEDGKPGLDLKASRFLSFFFFFEFLFYLFVYLWLCRVSGARRGLSLIAASKGCSLVAVCESLVAAAALVLEHGLQGAGASAVVAQGLPCSMACGRFLDQGLNLCLLHWEADSLLLSHQGSPRGFLFLKKTNNNFICIGI